MSSIVKGLAGTSLDQKRVERAALSRQLREEYSQLREISIILRKESKELSAESKLLRTNGRTLKEVVDEVTCIFAPPPQHS